MLYFFARFENLCDGLSFSFIVGALIHAVGVPLHLSLPYTHGKVQKSTPFDIRVRTKKEGLQKRVEQPLLKRKLVYDFGIPTVRTF